MPQSKECSFAHPLGRKEQQPELGKGPGALVCVCALISNSFLTDWARVWVRNGVAGPSCPPIWAPLFVGRHQQQQTFDAFRRPAMRRYRREPNLQLSI